MDTERTIGGLVARRAREIPDRIFLWCGDVQRSFAEVHERSDRIAAGLAALGVGHGDRIAFVTENRLEMLETLFACAKLGAIQVPLNVYLRGEFLRYQIDDAQAETIVADAAGVRSVAAAAPASVRRVIALDPDPAPAGGAEALAFADLLAADAPPPGAEVAASDPLSIVYTSGTTGMPKGCVLAHGYYPVGASVSRSMYGITPDDVVLTALPLFHAWALGTVVAALVHGLTAVVETSFSPEALLARLAETRATIFGGVGAMGMALLAQPPGDADRAHALRAALLIPFPPAEQERFEARFGARVFAQLYGQTECGAITHGSVRGPVRREGVGRPSEAFEVRIVDDTDTEVPRGEVGEIVVRPRVSDALFKGYWRDPDATARAWRNLWHHTGDYGRMDDDGFVSFVDRKSDSMRRRGENVSSVELERGILAHEKIAEVAVHAVPSPMTEDDIKVCIVLTGSASVTPEELFAFFKERLPYFAIPRYVEIVEDLPKTATMRVQKHLLRERGVTEDTWDLEALGLVVTRDERR